MSGIPTTYPPTTYAYTLAPQAAQELLSDVSAFYSVTGSAVMAYGSQAVGGEIYNVMSTLTSDECFEPTYGSKLPLRVFEPITARVQMDCLQDVYFAARDWTPHAGVSTSQTEAVGDPSNRLVGVEVAYTFGGASWTLAVPLTAALSGNL